MWHPLETFFTWCVTSLHCTTSSKFHLELPPISSPSGLSFPIVARLDYFFSSLPLSRETFFSKHFYRLHFCERAHLITELSVGLTLVRNSMAFYRLPKQQNSESLAAYCRYYYCSYARILTSPFFMLHNCTEKLFNKIFCDARKISIKIT